MRIAHLANFYGPRSGGLRTSIHALGAGYLERLDREPKEQEGGIAAVTALAPAYTPPLGRASGKPVQA